MFAWEDVVQVSEVESEQRWDAQEWSTSHRFHDSEISNKHIDTWQPVLHYASRTHPPGSKNLNFAVFWRRYRGNPTAEWDLWRWLEYQRMRLRALLGRTVLDLASLRSLCTIKKSEKYSKKRAGVWLLNMPKGRVRTAGAVRQKGHLLRATYWKCLFLHI